MERRLIPINAVLAMYSTTVVSWPRPLFNNGYRLEALEFPISVDDGLKVTPDAIGFNRTNNSFLVHEGKSGNNVDEDQAKRYEIVQPAPLVRTLSVTVSSSDTLRSQVNYVCLRECEERILLGLKSANLEVPVISVGDEDIRLVGAKFNDPELDAAFASPLMISGPPPVVLTVDAESSDEEFDNIVFPSLVAATSLSLNEISLAALTESSMPHYAIYPPPYQKRLQKCVEAAIRRAVSENSDRWEYRGSTGSDGGGLLRILASPEDADPRGRTQQYQAIRSRLATGRHRRIRPVAPGQGKFFGDDDLEAELDRAGSVHTEDEAKGEL
jgi:hypothetical protein